ncbi:MAG: PH domain-containing protein [Alphaproteobacteria bacterium]|nr:PH domain-containing protein [Alphaproteobacteria bacterium]
MKIAQKFKELSDRFNQNKMNISEMLSEGEEIKEVFQFHWTARIVAFKAIFIMAVFVLLSCMYQQLSWYNKAWVFFVPVLLVFSCFGLLIGVVFGIFELLVLNVTYFLLFGVILSIAYTLYSLLELQTLEMLITNRRVICRRGVFQFQTKELSLSKIESINVEQSIFGRAFNYATIIFSGVGTAKVEFEGVKDPWMAKSRIESIINEKEMM